MAGGLHPVDVGVGERVVPRPVHPDVGVGAIDGGLEALDRARFVLPANMPNAMGSASVAACDDPNSSTQRRDMPVTTVMIFRLMTALSLPQGLG